MCFLILSPIILTIAGIAWGWLWVEAVVVVPFFYLVSVLADIAVYGFVGTKLRGTLRTLGGHRIYQIVLGILDMALFYIGNRVIWLNWAAEAGPFDNEEGASWDVVTWEALVIVVGLATATGVAERIARTRHEHRIGA